MDFIFREFSKLAGPLTELTKRFQHKILGPLLVMLLTFIVGSSIQLAGSGQANKLPDFAPELSLWSTGILFTLSLLQDTKNSGRGRPSIIRRSSSYEVKVDLTTSERLGFDTQYLYALVFTMMTWILTIVINNQCARILERANALTFGAVVLNIIGCLLAGISIGVALCFLVNDLQEAD